MEFLEYPSGSQKTDVDEAAADLGSISSVVKLEGKHDPEGETCVDIGADDNEHKPQTESPLGLTCSVCGKTLLSKQSLSFHLMRHAGSYPYTCHLCDYKGVRKSRLKEHIRNNHGEKELKNAGVKLSLKTSTVLPQIPASQWLSCPDCDKKCTSKQNLENHMKQHSGERPHACPHCSYAAIQKIRLDRHMLYHHSKTKEELEGSLLCPKCPRILSTRDSLKYHLLVHEGSKPFECNLCHETFRDKKFVARHMRRKHSESVSSTDASSTGGYYSPIKCPKCDKVLSNRYSFKNHLRRHEKSFPCSHCGLQFKTKRQLGQHLKIHGTSGSGDTEEMSELIVGL